MTGPTLKDVVNMLLGLGDVIVPMLIGLALVSFFMGLVRYIYAAGGSATAHEYGRTLMLWGLIGLFVMVSIWGIVKFIQEAFTT